MTTHHSLLPLSHENIVWGLDPTSRQQAELLSELFNDSGFVEEVKSRLGGVKPNLKFYQSLEGLRLLSKILEKFEGSYRLLDAKCSDGYNTEKAMIGQFRDRIEALTIAPASGDSRSYIDTLQKPQDGEKAVDVISMGVMSFPGTIHGLIMAGTGDNIGQRFQLAKIRTDLNAGVGGIVMGATAYNTDIDGEIEKIHEKLNAGDKEFECLRGYNDEHLAIGIELRNGLFKMVLGDFDFNKSNTRLLVPGFGRQGGSGDFFIPPFKHSRSLFNAGSDIIKGLEDSDISTAKRKILERLESFLGNLQAFQKDKHTK